MRLLCLLACSVACWVLHAAVAMLGFVFLLIFSLSMYNVLITVGRPSSRNTVVLLHGSPLINNIAITDRHVITTQVYMFLYMLDHATPCSLLARKTFKTIIDALTL